MAISSVRTGYKACPECFGRGWNYSRFTTYAQVPCMACGGSGQVQNYAEFTLENIQIEIPPRETVAELRTKIAELESRIAPERGRTMNIPTNFDGTPLFPDLDEAELHRATDFIMGMKCVGYLEEAKLGLLLDRLLRNYHYRAAEIDMLKARNKALEKPATVQCGDCGRTMLNGDPVYVSWAGSKEYICQECVKPQEADDETL